MKKNAKRFLCIVLAVMLILSVSAIPAYAAQGTMSITLRIEGINANMYYKTVSVPYTDSLTLQAALAYIDAQESSIAITGANTGYITDINGESGGKFGGWDGWMYKVNGLEAPVGIDSYKLSNGDSVVLYYGDPYGVGMQYPAADTSLIAYGVIKFTSSDTTFDASYNPIVTVNPVVGATVTWNYGSKSATYITDKSGKITINKAQLTKGAHIIQISKKNGAGLPLVLRYAPGYTITVPAASGNMFSDVSGNDWFFEDVLHAYENGLMVGTSADKFSPNQAADRAMIVTILYRMEGKPAIAGSSGYTDVQGGTWYANAVTWAAKSKIVAGFGNNKFGPGAEITREQLALILYNYAKYKGCDMTAASSLSTFTDNGKVSNWALTAVKWAVGTGIITGRINNTLAPQSTATRAETASMLNRFINKNRFVPLSNGSWIRSGDQAEH